jgi:hypothetical protein
MLGVAASGALAIGALSTAGTAGATCASISGVGNGGGCTSSPGSFAVGLGNGTSATSTGLMSGAVANGLTNTTGQTTTANSFGNNSFAYASGPNTLAQAGSPVNPSSTSNNLAIAQGSNVQAFAGFTPGDTNNSAFNIANDTGPAIFNQVIAGGNGTTPGSGNIATNLGGVQGPGVSLVQAVGNNNTATNLGGSNNLVQAGAFGLTPATSSTAFNGPGSNNIVSAGPGPFAVAGVLASSNNIVSQTGTGLHVVP